MDFGRIGGEYAQVPAGDAQFEGPRCDRVRESRAREPAGEGRRRVSGSVAGARDDSGRANRSTRRAPQHLRERVSREYRQGDRVEQLALIHPDRVTVELRAGTPRIPRRGTVWLGHSARPRGRLAHPGAVD